VRKLLLVELSIVHCIRAADITLFTDESRICNRRNVSSVVLLALSTLSLVERNTRLNLGLRLTRILGSVRTLTRLILRSAGRRRDGRGGRSRGLSLLFHVVLLYSED
jgi:hypothetical protein